MASESLRPAYRRQKSIGGRMKATITAVCAWLISLFSRPVRNGKTVVQKLRHQVLRFEAWIGARTLRLDVRAVIEMNSIMTTVGLIVGAILGFALLASFAGTWFDFTGDLVENLTDADTGHAVGDAITGVFALVVAVLSPVAYVGLILGVLALPAIPQFAARRGGNRRRR